MVNISRKIGMFCVLRVGQKALSYYIDFRWEAARISGFRLLEFMPHSILGNNEEEDREKTSFV